MAGQRERGVQLVAVSIVGQLDRNVGEMDRFGADGLVFPIEFAFAESKTERQKQQGAAGLTVLAQTFQAGDQNRAVRAVFDQESGAVKGDFAGRNGTGSQGIDDADADMDLRQVQQRAGAIVVHQLHVLQDQLRSVAAPARGEIGDPYRLPQQFAGHLLGLRPVSFGDRQ